MWESSCRGSRSGCGPGAGLRRWAGCRGRRRRGSKGSRSHECDCGRSSSSIRRLRPLPGGAGQTRPRRRCVLRAVGGCAGRRRRRSRSGRRGSGAVRRRARSWSDTRSGDGSPRSIPTRSSPATSNSSNTAEPNAPPREYRTPTAAELAEFAEHFGRRRIELGNCVRPYNTPCVHEHRACVAHSNKSTPPNSPAWTRSKPTSSNASRLPRTSIGIVSRNDGHFRSSNRLLTVADFSVPRCQRPWTCN